MFNCCIVNSDLHDDEVSVNKSAPGTPNNPQSPSTGGADEPKFRRNRRAGVSAEAVTRERLENWEAKVFPKPEEDKAEIKRVIETHLNVVFGHLTPQSMNVVVDALELADVPCGTDIIKQGDDGDYFYIVKSGNFDIFVARGNDAPTKVASRGAGGYFGELALLYNAPRAATVRAVSDNCKVWKLDRNSFQMLLVSDNNTRTKKYEDMLNRVELFDPLNKYEKGQVSDLLVPENYQDGDRVIQQGTLGNTFYILEQGNAVALLKGSDADAREVEVKSYQPGDYFGEVALLNNVEGANIRKASIVAKGGPIKVLALDRADFDRVLGPIKDLMRERAVHYPTYAQATRK